MNGFGIVLAKEVVDNFRDRRTVMSSFGLAVLGPVLFVGLMVFIMERTLGESDDPIEFSVMGGEHAPQLMAYLEEQNATIRRIESGQPSELVISGDHELILVVNEDYAERYSLGNVNTLLLVHDTSKISSTRRHYSQIRSLIAQYGRTIGLLRLQLRGVDPSIVMPITTQELDVSSPAARALTVLASLPYFLVLVIFMGGFYLAIDTTAGEREHGSLEPLLTQPVSRAQLVLGKLTAAAVFGGLSLVIFLTSLYLVLPFVPFDRVGMALEFGAPQMLKIFVVAIPLIFLASALLTAVASYAKSYKEAQTYLTLVILIPTLPLILSQLLGLKTSITVMLVPSLAQATLMADIIKGEPVAAAHVAVATLVTVAATILLAWVAIALYRRERILG